MVRSDLVGGDIAVFEHHVMGAAFDDAGGGDEGDAGIFLELRDRQSTAVAHGGFDFVQGHLNVVLEAAGVRYVGIDAFFEGELACAAHIVALPVAGAGGTFAPVLFHVVAADVDLVGGAFVKAGEVAAQHDEVSAHSQSQGHVVVVNDTAVGADGDVDAGLFVIFVAGFGHIDDSGSLSAADTFLLTGDTDGAAADADFDEVCASFSQEAEAFAVNDIACADFDGIAVFFADEIDGHFLPFGIAFGGVDAEDVCAGFD